MFYPKMAEIPTTRDILDKFKGYDHNLRIGDGEFFDMKNLTSDHYPVLSPRKNRGTYLTTKDANGMCSNTKFCYVDGQNFYVGDQEYDLKLTSGSKELISMGTNVIIMPDQKYINTIKADERGGLIEGVFTIPDKIQGSDVLPKLKMTVVNPNTWETLNDLRTDKKFLIVRKGEKLPAASSLAVGSIALYWVSKGYVWYHVKDNSSNGIVWESRPWDSEYLYFAVYGKDDDSEYFENKIKEIKESATDKYITIRGLHPILDGQKLYLVQNTATFTDYETSAEGVTRNALLFRWKNAINYAANSAEEIDENNQLVESLFAKNTSQFVPISQDTPITVETKASENSTVPKMDFITESGNRLWGCRYGESNSGAFVNEIYASALGNFKDWTTKDGVSTDSYAASVGTSGKFTGAINFGGKPIFFKEDCMHRVFGDFPSNFQVQMLPCKGVQEGCSKSLAIVNDVLYYKSRTGICAYDGSLPVEISLNFGDKQYRNAVGGSLGNKYYVSMQDEKDEWNLFVYDTIKRMWHKEDDLQATQFCNHKGELYYIDYADRYIHSINGTGVEETAPIPWMAETGILGANTPDNKYVSRLDLRMSVARGSEVAVYIEYDSMGDWEKIADIEGLALNTFTIPVQPRRCDHFRLKFVGEGDAKIFSISKVLEESE